MRQHPREVVCFGDAPQVDPILSGGEVLDHYVVARAGIDSVVAAAADDDVVPLAAAQHVVARAAEDQVVARPTVEYHADRSGREVACVEDIVAVAASDFQLIERTLRAADVDARR